MFPILAFAHVLFGKPVSTFPGHALAASIGLAAGHGRSGRRAVAAEDARVDHGDAAAFDHRDRLLERLLKLAGVPARAEALGALAARHHADVDVRICNALADPLV